MNEGLRDIQGTVLLPSYLVWWIILGVVVCVGILLYFLFKHKKDLIKPPEPTIVQPPWERALERLAELKQANYLHENAFNAYYSDLTDIIRQYIEERFTISAPDMTTEEFLHHLQTTDKLNTAHKQILKDFLTEADMVKFAKFTPGVDTAEKGWNLAKQFVVETK